MKTFPVLVGRFIGVFKISLLLDKSSLNHSDNFQLIDSVIPNGHITQ